MISVIIPVLDGAAVVPTTVPAVLRLAGDIEVIWVDDGSTDGTADLIAAALPAGGPHQVLRLDRNRGRAVARNRGVAATQGDTLVFFDIDVEPDADSALALADAVRQPGAVASVGRLQPVPEDPRDPYQDYATAYPRGPSRDHPTDAALDWRFFLSGVCAIRRSAFEAAGGFPEAVTYGEDLALAQQLAMESPQGLRLAPTTVRLHDLGDLDRALRNAAQYGQDAARLDARRPQEKPSQMSAVAWLAPATGPAVWGLERLARRDRPGPLRRRAVRYLLGFTALRSYRRARDQAAEEARLGGHRV